MKGPNHKSDFYEMRVRAVPRRSHNLCALNVLWEAGPSIAEQEAGGQVFVTVCVVTVRCLVLCCDL